MKQSRMRRWLVLLVVLAFPVWTAAGREGCATATETAVPAASRGENTPTDKTYSWDDLTEDDDTLALFVTADHSEGEAPLVVQFNVRSLAVDQVPKPHYRWYFNDGSEFSQEPNPTHTFTKAGSFVVVVKVIDAAGRGGYDEIEIDVHPSGWEKRRMKTASAPQTMRPAPTRGPPTAAEEE